MRLFDNYYFAYLKYLLLHRNEDILIKYFRRKGISIGENCHIYSSIATPEAYLITIGNNVTIAPGVRFLTHDNSVSKLSPMFTDVFGKIQIGDNCFIGANAVLLPGVELGANTIVAAGSIVTKSHTGNIVIGGNPAKPISSFEDYKKKIEKYCSNVDGMSFSCKKKYLLSDEVKLLKR